MKKGFFITLEGIEGAGKSTMINFIEDYLTKISHDVIKTREPGGTKIGEQIRTILLKNENNNLTADTELLLMFAARVQHLNEIFAPALSLGKTILLLSSSQPTLSKSFFSNQTISLLLLICFFISSILSLFDLNSISFHEYILNTEI